MSFVPPQFNDINKQVKDLFSKKYDYDNCFKIKKSGAVDIETSGNFSSGAVKTSFSKEGSGDFELQAGTCGMISVQHEYSMNSNMKTKVNAKSCGGEITGSVAATFSQDSMAGNMEVGSNGNIVASAVVGVDDLSVGGKFQYNFKKSEVGDFNVGVQYSGFKDSTVSLISTNKMDAVEAGCWMKASNVMSVGTMVKCTTDSNSLGFGFEKEMDANTTLKGKISLGAEQGAAFAIQHSLFDTNMKIGLAADLKAPYYNFPPSFKSVGLTLNL